MGLDAHNATLQMIFTQPAQLQVARYQRHYEWTKSEIGQLIQDLLKSYEMSKTDPKHEYFIGNFVLHDKSQSEIEIIDGQQRLTSFAILFAALRDLTNNQEQSAFINSYITNAHLMENKAPQPRLFLRRGDNSYFEELVATTGSTNTLDQEPEKKKYDSYYRMKENAALARKMVSSNLAPEDYAPFFAFVTQKCRVILITVDNEDDAIRIFKTMNSRGRPLVGEDILRVDWIYYADEDSKERDILLEQWRQMERTVGGQQWMPLFIEQLRLRRMHGQPRKASLHKEIVASFQTPEEAKAYIENDMTLQAKVYREMAINKRIKKIVNGTIKKQVNYLCRSLALVDFAEWIPVAMMLIERYELAEPEALLLRLKALDRLAWFYYLKHDDINIQKDREKRFGKIIAHMMETEQFNDNLNEFQLQPKEKAEMRGFVSNRIDPKWVPLKNLLVRLEYAYQPERLLYHLRGLTIEHILPVNPGTVQYWYNQFGGMKQVTENTEMIGNLCLLPYEINKEMSNKAFRVKQRIMRREKLVFSSTLTQAYDEDDWTPKIIKNRTYRILDKFCAEFDLEHKKANTGDTVTA